MQFEVKGYVSVKHINIRKDGPSDGKEVAVDLKLTAEGCPARTICALLGVDSEAEAAISLWDADGNPRFSGITDITSWAEFSGKHSLKLAGLPDVPCKRVHKFKFSPRGERTVDVEFCVSVVSPPRQYVETLGELLQDEVPCDLRGEPELDFGEAA